MIKQLLMDKAEPGIPHRDRLQEVAGGVGSPPWPRVLVAACGAVRWYRAHESRLLGMAGFGLLSQG